MLEPSYPHQQLSPTFRTSRTTSGPQSTGWQPLLTSTWYLLSDRCVCCYLVYLICISLMISFSCLLAIWISSCEMRVQVFGQFFHWVVCLFLINLWNICTYVCVMYKCKYILYNTYMQVLCQKLQISSLTLCLTFLFP